jgi:hypothetical protein
MEPSTLFNFGQQANSSTPDRLASPFVFRGLHNASPGTPIPFPKPKQDIPTPSIENRTPDLSPERAEVIDVRTSDSSLVKLTGNLSLNEKKKQYDPRDEILPDKTFFTKEFQSSLAESVNLAQKAAKILTEIEKKDSNQAVRQLIAKADELSRYESSQMTTIALLGNSGDGKSSLINSLLHYPELARTVSYPQSWQISNPV